MERNKKNIAVRNQSRNGSVYFVSGSRRRVLPQSSSRTTFGKLCQRPIELEEFSEKGRSMNFGVTGPMLEDYRSVTIL